MSSDQQPTPEYLYDLGTGYLQQAAIKSADPDQAGTTAALAAVAHATLLAALVRHVLDGEGSTEVFGQGTVLPTFEGNSGPGAPNEP
jgi:hypothetical protein